MRDDVVQLVIAAHHHPKVTGGMRGPIEQALEMFTDAQAVASVLDRLDQSVAFVATVVGVDLEESSGRMIVTVNTGRDDQDEHLRTDRMSDPTGPLMRDRVLRLRGHRCVIWKEIQTAANDSSKKVRILPWIEPATQPKPAVSSDRAAPPVRPADDRSARHEPPAEGRGGQNTTPLRREFAALGERLERADAWRAVRWLLADKGCQDPGLSLSALPEQWSQWLVDVLPDDDAVARLVTKWREADQAGRGAA